MHANTHRNVPFYMSMKNNYNYSYIRHARIPVFTIYLKSQSFHEIKIDEKEYRKRKTITNRILRDCRRRYNQMKTEKK